MIRLVRVAGASMAPTYRASDLLLTRPVGRAGASVRPGDVVVFRRDELRMVKRVVGLPGDLVELEAGRLFVNGEPVDGRPRVRGAFIQRWRVPASSWFVVGDNTAASDDSRVWDEPFVRGLDAIVVRRLWGRGGRVSPRRRTVAARQAARSTPTALVRRRSARALQGPSALD